MLFPIFSNRFPFTKFNDVNLDWFLSIFRASFSHETDVDMNFTATSNIASDNTLSFKRIARLRLSDVGDFTNESVYVVCGGYATIAVTVTGNTSYKIGDVELGDITLEVNNYANPHFIAITPNGVTHPVYIDRTGGVWITAPASGIAAQTVINIIGTQIV